MKKLILFSLLTFIITSCKKGETPVDRIDRGGVTTNQLDMSTDYRYQLYYDLETDAIVGQNLKTDWDLGFSGGENDWAVFLNSSKYMAVWKSNETQLNSISDTVGANWVYDNVRGKIDSTAIGDWRNHSKVYVIDRGYNWNGVHQGFFKMLILNQNTTSYHIQVAKMDNSVTTSYIINKNDDYNLIGFSFDFGEIQVEPPKKDWDLHFTQYTHVYEDGETYLVNGVLQNSYNTFTAEDSTLNFIEINSDDIPNLNYSEHRNTIGFDWKYYSFNTSSFIIRSNINYVVHTSDNRYFKLHFIDFYNDLGEKGHPTFEVQEL